MENGKSLWIRENRRKAGKTNFTKKRKITGEIVKRAKRAV